jgi:hypothetical protein
VSRDRAKIQARTTAASAAVVRAALCLAVVAVPLAAQEEGDRPLVRVPSGEQGWDTERVLDLVERARERRRQPVADSALRSYRADVTGFIYFFIDRESEPEPVLLRADQVALDLYWARPNQVKQVVRGMRSEEQFPIKNFRYYLDRYTVIQNGFDDVIRVGEGRDVRNVIHPLAVQGRGYYQFRLADSTTIRLPGQSDPIRVYEVQVRPRNFDIPAIVGSLFLERARGDLVRLAFTFTPSAYLDPRNERVEVMLENGLWEGRYWLPREQRLLVRREIPELDLDVGTVIRGGLRVQDYDFNVDLPAPFFQGREVVMAAGPEVLEAYEFDEGLYEGFDDIGMAGAEPGTLDDVDVDAIADRILRERFLRGIPRMRLFAATASDVLRYDRTEGLVLGAGGSYGIGRSQLNGYAGFAFGAERPLAAIGWRPAGPDPAGRVSAEAYLNRPVEIGLRPPASGVVATLSAVTLGEDLRDVFPAHGARVAWRSGSGLTRQWRAELAWEEHQDVGRSVATAPFDDERAFRPGVPVEPGHRVRLELGHVRRTGVGPATVALRPSAALVYRPGEVGVDRGCVTDTGGEPVEVDCPSGLFARLGLDAEAAWSAGDRRTGLEARLSAAILTTDRPPPQDLLWIGGRNTIPGHPLHAYVGSRAITTDLTVWRDLVPRLVRLRLLAAAGWAGPSDLLPPVPDTPADAPFDPWVPGPTDDVAASVGAGLGLVDGIVRLDWLVRTDTGGSTVLLTVDPRLWSFL